MRVDARVERSASSVPVPMPVPTASGIEFTVVLTKIERDQPDHEEAEVVAALIRDR